MNEWINTPTAGEYSLLQNWARFPGEKVGGRIAVIEQSQTQKDQKVGYQMGFFPLLGLAEIDIYLPRGFFFFPAEIYILRSKPQLTCAQLIISMRLRKAGVRYPEAC